MRERRAALAETGPRRRARVSARRGGFPPRRRLGGFEGGGGCARARGDSGGVVGGGSLGSLASRAARSAAGDGARGGENRDGRVRGGFVRDASARHGGGVPESGVPGFVSGGSSAARGVAPLAFAPRAGRLGFRLGIPDVFGLGNASCVAERAFAGELPGRVSLEPLARRLARGFARAGPAHHPRGGRGRARGGAGARARRRRGSGGARGGVREGAA